MAPTREFMRHIIATRLTNPLVRAKVFQVDIEPHWKLDQLGDQDKTWLFEQVEAAVDAHRDRIERGKLTEAKLYAMVLDWHGIQCPHPDQYRIAYRPTVGVDEEYECRACGSLVVRMANVPRFNWTYQEGESR